MNTEDTPVSPSLAEATDATNETTSSPAFRITEAPKPEVPLLNRAQRRQLTKATKHKAALQARHDLAVRRRAMVKALKHAKMAMRQAKYAAGIID